MANTNFKLNTILFGPPGTGKTYNTVIDAVAICSERDVENEIHQGIKEYKEILKEFNDLKDNGRIAFTTFHQSYGYEDFIEGIRPVTTDNGQISYEVQDGSFKKFCKRAEQALKSAPVQNATASVATAPNTTAVVQSAVSNTAAPVQSAASTSVFDTAWNQFMGDLKNGKIIIAKRHNTKTQFNINYHDPDTIYITWSGGTNNTVKRDETRKQWGNGYSTAIKSALPKGGSQQTYEFTWGIIDELIENYGLPQTPPPQPSNQVSPRQNQVQSQAALSDDYQMDQEKSESEQKNTDNVNYVYIIDEINRGNISKIFGELITLIEDSKRLGEKEAMTATLPYSGEEFGVPNNVYILGTMNTADRSIAIMDTALRRRFDFREMMPDPSLLDGEEVTSDGITVNIKKMLSTMNTRIEYLLDREHTLGHAFFMPLKKTSDPNTKLTILADIFRNKIIPLLQEYFFDDYEKIQYVLGDNAKSSDKYKFIKVKESNTNIFKGEVPLNTNKNIYSINDEEAFDDINSYLEIYTEV